MERKKISTTMLYFKVEAEKKTQPREEEKKLCKQSRFSLSRARARAHILLRASSSNRHQHTHRQRMSQMKPRVVLK